MGVFLLNATRKARDIPWRLRWKLDEFRRRGTPTGHLLISFPLVIQNVVATPLTNRQHVGATTSLAGLQAIMNQYLGEMISYEAEAEGQLFQDMVPNPDLAQTQTSLGSATELELHVEQAFSRWRPDVVSLACLRGDPEAKTYVFHVKDALKHLTSAERRLLWEPLWTIGVDLSFKMHGQEFVDGDQRGPLPILHAICGDDIDNEQNNNIGWVFDQDLMRGINPSAEDLRLKLIDVYIKHRNYIILKPGDLLWIDNQRAVHGRSPYVPRFDGTDRFLVRSFVTYDLLKSASVRQGRMVLAKYS